MSTLKGRLGCGEKNGSEGKMGGYELDVGLMAK